MRGITLTTAALLLAACVFAGGGCGGEEERAPIVIIEVAVNPGGTGASRLLEAGMRQLENELSLEVIEQEWPTADITSAVEAQRDAGADLALVLGRGDLVLDPGVLAEGTTLVGLNVGLRDGSGRALGEGDGVFEVRYRVEEGAYLGGLLAASVTTDRGIGRMNPEAVVAYIGCPASAQERAWRLGFERGVAEINPNCAIAEYDLPSPDDLANARAAVDTALKLKADVIFCAPGAFQQEVLALAAARGFLVITSDAEPGGEEPEALLAGTVLRDDLAMFRAAHLFAGGGDKTGAMEWGREEGVVDFSVSSRYASSLPLSILQVLQRPLPRDLPRQ